MLLLARVNVITGLRYTQTLLGSARALVQPFLLAAVLIVVFPSVDDVKLREDVR